MSLTCPKCGRDGTFNRAGNNDVVTAEHRLQIRRCPNRECAALVYLVSAKSGGVEASYPPLRIDFDATDVPQDVVKTFEESITCHASG